MAFVSTNSNIRNSILGFIRHLVSKRVYKAIEIILTPCCHPVVTSVEAVCNGGVTVVTVKFSSNINLYGAGQGKIYLWVPILNIFVGSTAIYADNGTVTFEFLNLIGAGGYSASVELFMPTSSDGLVGVSLSSEEFIIGLPDCGI
jgi:hypothetical protein